MNTYREEDDLEEATKIYDDTRKNGLSKVRKREYEKMGKILSCLTDFLCVNSYETDKLFIYIGGKRELQTLINDEI